MRKDAVALELSRLREVTELDDYTAFHERHRIFPAVFEDRQHRSILDAAAGVGCAARRIRDGYPGHIVCNDICPKCVAALKALGVETTSFDLDGEEPYPFDDGQFDAVISLSTLEHLIQTDRFLQEVHRILSAEGYLYISVPNYAGLYYLLPFLLSGRTFHNPLSEWTKYEFYAHVRYFTYRTLLDYVSAFGFTPEAVYLALPGGSSRYQRMRTRNRLKAFLFRESVRLLYTLFPPRWASEPVLCFRKGRDVHSTRKPRKVVL